MFIVSIALVVGVLLFQQFAALPDNLWSSLIILVPICWWRKPSLAFVWAFCFGFLWALSFAHWQTTPPLPPDLEGEDLTIEGIVADLPESNSRRTRFLFDINRLEQDGVAYPPPGRIRLSWYDNLAEPRVGERWRLKVRLRRPRGLMNPFGFDYEGWLFHHGIAGTGYVRTNPSNKRLGFDSGTRYLVNRWRQSIRDKIIEQTGLAGNGAVLVALTVGDRGGLSDTDWQLLRRTGTSHLIAISGLHISIIAGIGFFAGRRLFRVFTRALNSVPVDTVGALLALVLATIYAALAGFSIPTQRALIMLSIVLGGILLKRTIRPFHTSSTALTVVVLLDPLSVLAIGFWLSFGAVAAILFALSWRINRSRLTAIGGIQWYVFISLIPILFAFGLEISLLSPVINLVAVPLFSFIIVPAALISTLFLMLLGDVAGPLLDATAATIGAARELLEAAAELAPRFYPGRILSLLEWGSIVVGILLLLAPRGIPARWLGLFFLLPLFGDRGFSPGTGGVALTVLDVGQGMAVVVRTSNHTLLYDTGPRSFGGFDAGASVVLPHLRGMGISRIDRLVISNGDSDHSGGLEAVIGGLEIDDIYSGEPSRINAPGTLPCVAGDHWTWDRVRFSILHPSARGWRGNDASCVLQVDTGARRILLTGDIEKAAEMQLVRERPTALKSDLTVVPHHGSESSSTPAFVDTVQPSYAIVSSGYGNRYGFPRGKVIDRWEDQGALVLNTAEAGAIQFLVSPEGEISGPQCFRESGARYWTQRGIAPCQAAGSP